MIYLMRHGDIRPMQGGAPQNAGEKRYIGQTDIPLNERGRARAKQWRDDLLNVNFDRIICSDLSRTRETATIISGRRTIPVEELSAFREIHMGQWDGQLMSAIKTRFFDEWRKRGETIASFRPPGGESFMDLLERSLPAFFEIAPFRHENVLIVAHAGVNRVLLCHFSGIPLDYIFTIKQDYSCLNLLSFSGSWKVSAINQTFGC